MANQRHDDWNGSHWVRDDLRLGIFLRDGMACSWCGVAVEDGASLTLDHLIPVSKGGKNGCDNLVTACKRCNFSRGDRDISDFSMAVASYINHGISGCDILAYVMAQVKIDLAPFRAQAKDLIAQRGTAAKVLAALKAQDT